MAQQPSPTKSKNHSVQENLPDKDSDPIIAIFKKEDRKNISLSIWLYLCVYAMLNGLFALLVLDLFIDLFGPCRTYDFSGCFFPYERFGTSVVVAGILVSLRDIMMLLHGGKESQRNKVLLSILFIAMSLMSLWLMMLFLMYFSLQSYITVIWLSLVSFVLSLLSVVLLNVLGSFKWVKMLSRVLVMLIWAFIVLMVALSILSEPRLGT